MLHEGIWNRIGSNSLSSVLPGECGALGLILILSLTAWGNSQSNTCNGIARGGCGGCCCFGGLHFVLALLLAVVFPNDCKTCRADLKTTGFAFLCRIWFASRSPILFSVLSFLCLSCISGISVVLLVPALPCGIGFLPCSLQSKISGIQRISFPQAAGTNGFQDLHSG